MISEHASVAVAALQQLDKPARERVAKAVIAKASTYEKRRQGKDSGRGPLHRRHEVGTPNRGTGAAGLRPNPASDMRGIGVTGPSARLGRLPVAQAAEPDRNPA
jgi:hypothetical protein